MCGSRKNPYPPHGGSLEIPRGRGGVLKAKFLEEMYENKLEFPGGRGGCKTKTFRGGGGGGGCMDIFWNCTICVKLWFKRYTPRRAIKDAALRLALVVLLIGLKSSMTESLAWIHT